MLISPLEIINGAFILSLNNFPEATPPTSDHRQVSQWAQVALIATYAAILAYRWWHPLRYRRSVWLAVEALAVLASSLAAWAWWVPASDPRKSTALPWTAPVVMLLLALWRAAHLLLPRRRVSAHAGCTDIARLSRAPFHIIWICRSLSLLRGYLPELARVLGGVHDHLGAVSLSVYCTAMGDAPPRVRASTLAQIVAEIGQLGLHGAVHFHRPHLETLLADDMRNQLLNATLATRGTTQRTLVTFCGGPGVGAACERAAIAANALAEVTNQRKGHRFEFLFREEHYGIAAGKQRRHASKAAVCKTPSKGIAPAASLNFEQAIAALPSSSQSSTSCAMAAGAAEGVDAVNAA